MILCGGSLIDGTGAEARTADIVIQDGIITEIRRPGTSTAADHRVIDCANKHIIPGLWDSHVHITQDGTWTRDFPGDVDVDVVLANLGSTLRWGVTSVIDAMGSPTELADLRVRQRGGEHPDTATLYLAGPGITAPGGHPVSTMMKGRPQVAARTTRQVADPPAAAAVVEEVIAEFQVDVIKAFYTSLWHQTELTDPAVLTAVVEAAAAHGRGVIVHVDWGPEAAEAIRCGVTGLEHICQPGSLDEAIQLAAEHDIIWTPTLAVFDAFAHSGDREWLRRQRDYGADESILATFTAEGSKWLQSGGPRLAEMIQGRIDGVSQAHQAGVSLAVGTDAGANGTFHGIAVHRELELLVEAGLSPTEAITAATSHAARKLNIHDVGTITPGAAADLVILNQDPLRDIANTRSVSQVIHRGRLLFR